LTILFYYQHSFSVFTVL